MANSKLIKIFVFFTLFLLNNYFISAQNDISINTSVDTTVIGYDIPLNISIPPNLSDKSFNLMVLDPGAIMTIYAGKYNFPNVDTITKSEVDFEISDYGKWKGDNNTFIVNKSDTNQIKIKVWDVGEFIVLPALINKSDGVLDTLYPDRFETYPTFVVYGSSTPNDTIRDFTPIKDILREEKNWLDYKMWIISVIVILILLMAIIFIPKLLKKKEKKVYKTKEKIILPPAHITALEQLEKLKAEKIWKEGRFKEFQSKLTHILREYLERRYKISALEQTTGEIISSLEKFSISDKDINSLKNILQIADLVKFAKAKPGEDINEEFLNETFDFVNKTKELEEIKNV